MDHSDWGTPLFKTVDLDADIAKVFTDIASNQTLRIAGFNWDVVVAEAAKEVILSDEDGNNVFGNIPLGVVGPGSSCELCVQLPKAKDIKVNTNATTATGTITFMCYKRTTIL